MTADGAFRFLSSKPLGQAEATGSLEKQLDAAEISKIGKWFACPSNPSSSTVPTAIELTNEGAYRLHDGGAGVYVRGPHEMLRLMSSFRFSTTLYLGDDAFAVEFYQNPSRMIWIEIVTSASGRSELGQTAKELVTVRSPLDLTAKEVDLHLIDHDASSATLDLGDGSAIDVRASKEFRRWVIWTLAGKDFVCLEPWTCPGNALNGDDRDLLRVDAGEPTSLWTEIELRPSPS